LYILQGILVNWYLTTVLTNTFTLITPVHGHHASYRYVLQGPHSMSSKAL